MVQAPVPRPRVRLLMGCRHWPIGVLFDLHTSFDPTAAMDAPGGHPHLPWQLTVHFQDYPTDVLTRRDSPDSLRDVWLNNLKQVFLPHLLVSLVDLETSTLQHGSAKRIFSLPNTQIQSLYQSLTALDPTTFHSIYAPLSSSPRHIPLRLFLPPPHPPLTPLLPPLIATTEKQTVGTALHQVLPSLFPSRQTCLFARPMAHGIVVPMTAPLGEVSEVFRGGDGWTDIVIVMMT